MAPPRARGGRAGAARGGGARGRRRPAAPRVGPTRLLALLLAAAAAAGAAGGGLPARSLLGRVQECGGPPAQRAGRLCGASGAFARGGYLYVAAADSDALTVVDVRRPSHPFVSGSLSHRRFLSNAHAVDGYTSKVGGREYVAVAARGRHPDSFGFLTLVDVGEGRWRAGPETSFRQAAEPAIAGVVSECRRSTDGTFPRIFGRLCGPSGVAVRGPFAFVSSEQTHTLAAVALHNPANPIVVGAVTDSRLDYARDVALFPSEPEAVYVVSRHCGTSCLVEVNAKNPNSMFVARTLPPAEAPGRVHGLRPLARGVADPPGVAFVVEKSGLVAAVDVACVEERLRSGGRVSLCASRGVDMSLLGPAPATLLTDTVVTLRPDGATRLVHDEPGLLNVAADGGA